MMPRSNQHPATAKSVVLIVFCLSTLVGLPGCSDDAHYRARHDAKSLFRVLHSQVKPGDTMQRVQELLGRGQPPEDPEKSLARARKFAERQPQSFPVGVRDDDRFLEYSAGNLGVILQFRDGRLINFDTNQFKQLPEVSRLGSP